MNWIGDKLVKIMNALLVGCCLLIIALSVHEAAPGFWSLIAARVLP